MTLRRFLQVLPLAAVFAVGSAQAAAPADQILGIWSPDAGHDSKIEIVKCADRYCAVIVWMRLPHNDDKNEDVRSRRRPLTAARIMTGLKYEGGTAWNEAKLYSPELGKTSDAKFVLVNKGELQIQETFGADKKTTIWKRVAE